MVKVILSPHLDDETLCLGGSIAKWADQGHSVVLVEFFCSDTVCNGKVVRSVEREDELHEADYILGFDDYYILKSSRHFEDNSTCCPVGPVVAEVEKIVNTIHADEIYFPSVTEHQDHEFVNRVGHIMMRASRGTGVDYYEYPMPYRALDNVLEGDYIDITGYVEVKKGALSKFTSQMRENGVISKDALRFNEDIGIIFGDGKVYEKVIPKRRFK